MEKLTSRKNPYIVHLRSLGGDAGYRYSCGEYLCDGHKLFREALEFGAEISSVLWKNVPDGGAGLPASVRQYYAPEDLFTYASPMSNSPGPLFTVRIPEPGGSDMLKNALIIEGVQDPGNVGTVLRSANAFGISAVVLVGECADAFSPKTVRSTMGAIFRQRIIRTDIQGLSGLLRENGLKLYGAVLSDDAVSIADTDVTGAAVAVGSEGRGLSRELISICDGKLIIPMEPDSESLNAAVAASIIMWEMSVKK